MNYRSICTKSFIQIFTIGRTQRGLKKCLTLRVGTILDLGVMDSDGYIKIVGRTKEMIIVGGENVYPREIEEILHIHPSIFDVHVIGVPDARTGEAICAFVKLNKKTRVSQKEMKQFCQDKMAYYKIPKYFLFVENFQMTSTGKVQKFRMREIACEQLNLN